MEYSIFYLIEGDAEKYQNQLVRDISQNFGENSILKSNLPTGIALKVPFEVGNIGVVEKVIEDFVKKEKPAKIATHEFGKVKKMAAVIHFKLSKQASKLQRKLLEELEEAKIKSHRYDRKFKAHSIIVYSKTKREFRKILRHLSKMKKPKFKLKINNIAIMRKVGKVWKLHKKFKIK